MNEFMLFIKAKGNPIAQLSQSKQETHIQKVGSYIGGLFEEGKMKGAQPLIPEGVVLYKKAGAFSGKSFDPSGEEIHGYYHLQAANLDEAIAIAKKDPRFEDGDWKIEVRPVLKLDGIN